MLYAGRHSTHDFLDVLTCGLPARERKNRLFAMLVAHVDDSGSQGEGPVFILAGYVADTDQWKRFSDQWQMALDLRPKLKRLKIQEAFHREELWGRTKPEDRDERLKRFASIIHRHVRFGVVAWLAWDDIRRLRKEFRVPKEFPYLILYNQLMARIVYWIKREELDERVDFVFDEQGALSRIAPASFVKATADIPQEFMKLVGGPPIHRSDEVVLPLQAAHTIAWLVRRHAYENSITGEALSEWKPTQPYLKKLEAIDMLWTWTNYEKLLPTFQRADERARAAAKA